MRRGNDIKNEIKDEILLRRLRFFCSLALRGFPCPFISVVHLSTQHWAFGGAGRGWEQGELGASPMRGVHRSAFLPSHHTPNYPWHEGQEELEAALCTARLGVAAGIVLPCRGEHRLGPC